MDNPDPFGLDRLQSRTTQLRELEWLRDRYRAQLGMSQLPGTRSAIAAALAEVERRLTDLGEATAPAQDQETGRATASTQRRSS